MASITIEQLASQAEKEGVTLAEMITKYMSAEDLDRTQAEIHAELARNYMSIEGFMQEIESASPLNLAGLSEDELLDLQEEVVLSLSDSCGIAAEEDA